MPKVSHTAVTSCWTPLSGNCSMKVCESCVYMDLLSLLKDWSKSQKGHCASCWGGKKAKGGGLIWRYIQLQMSENYNIPSWGRRENQHKMLPSSRYIFDWKSEKFELLVMLNEKSGSDESYEDSSFVRHGYLYQISWQSIQFHGNPSNSWYISVWTNGTDQHIDMPTLPLLKLHR